MDTVHECDGRTDGRTDGQTDGRTDRITITKTVQRIASHGKNYLKEGRLVWQLSLTWVKSWQLLIVEM